MGWHCDAWPGHEGFLLGWRRDEYFGLLELQRPPIPFDCDSSDLRRVQQGRPDLAAERLKCLRAPGKECCRFCGRRLRPGYPTELADVELQRVRVPVHAVQVGCDCAWRSPLLGAPYQTEWHDGLLCLPESAQETESTDRLGLVPFEAKCVRLWLEHCRQCGAESDARPRLRGELPIEARAPEPPIDVAANREFLKRYFLKRF